MAVDVAGERLTGRGCVGKAVAHIAEIDVEIFGSRGPVPAEPAEQVERIFDAGADGQSGVDMLECKGPAGGRFGRGKTATRAFNSGCDARL